MGGNRTIRVTVTGDASSLKRAMAGSEASLRRMDSTAKKSQGSLSRMEKGMATAMKATAVIAGGAAITRALGDVLDAASRVEQSAGAMDAVFKGQAESMHTAAEAAQALGISQSGYGEMATVLGAQLKNLGTAQADLAPTTQDLIEHGADLAAMFGGTASDAVRALSATFRGEYDPIEKYGATLRKSSVTALMSAEGLSQADATIQILMSQTADAVGQAAREFDTYASAQARMSAGVENAKATLGEGLLPVFSLLSAAAGSLATAFSAIPPSLISVTAGLAGAIGAVKGYGAVILKAEAALGLLETRLYAQGKHMRGLGAGLAQVAFRRLAGAAVIAGAALATYSAAAGKAADAGREMAATSDELTRQLSEGVDLLTRDVSHVDPWWADFMRTEDVTPLIDSLHTLDDSFVQLWASGDVFGGKQAQLKEEVKNTVAAYAELAKTDPGDAADKLTALNDALHDSSLSADEVAREFPELAGALETAGESADSAATKTANLTAGFDAAKQAASDFAAAMAAVFAGDDAGRAMDAYTTSVLDLRDAIKSGDFDQSAGLKKNTRAALANRAAVRQVADAARAHTGAMITNGASIRDVMGTYRSQRGSLMETVGSMFKTKKAANRYIDTLLGTPDDIRTAFEAATSGANADVNAYQGNLAGTPRNLSTIFTVKFTKSDPLGVSQMLGWNRALPAAPEPPAIAQNTGVLAAPRMDTIFGRKLSPRKRVTLTVYWQADIQAWTSGTKAADAQVRKVEKAIAGLEKRLDKAGKKQKKRIRARLKAQRRILRNAEQEVRVAERAVKQHAVMLAAEQARIQAAQTLARSINKIDIGRAWTDAQSGQADALKRIDEATKNIAENFWNPRAVTHWKAELAKAQNDLAASSVKAQVKAQVDKTKAFLADIKRLQGQVSDAVLGDIISTGNADLARELVNDKALRDYYNAQFTEMQKLTYQYTNTLGKGVYDATYWGVTAALKKAFGKYKINVKNVRRSRMAPAVYNIKVDAALSDPDAVAHRIEDLISDRAYREGAVRV